MTSRRGRGSSRQPVFGFHERGGRVCAGRVPDAKKKTIQDVIRGKAAPEAVVVPGGSSACNGLVDICCDRHLRLSRRQHGFVHDRVQISGIESLWSFTKRRLARFDGVRRKARQTPTYLSSKL